MLTRGRWLGRGRSLLGLRPSIRHSLSGRCGRSAPCAGHLALPSIGCVPRSLSAMSGPTPVWDSPEAAISRNDAPLRLQPGTLHKVVWMCWTGTNPMPAHLRLCLQTVRKNSGLEVILVTPDNLAEYVPDPHPGYKFLHLAHRADYLRCYLLHNYGGIYLDCDTIVLKSLEGLFDALEDFDAVGYDGSPWGEFIGISDMGPFKPGTELTNLWFAALHGKLEMKMPETESKKTDVFYWQEILRDIFVPASLMHRQKISKALQALNPAQEQLYSTLPFREALSTDFDQSHILILNNANYGQDLKGLSEEQILNSPAVLSQLLRHALGTSAPEQAVS
eukprot:gnl/TRDRNA2_/TRDRNA2_133154_c0_seq1.p1 gnl/TRDRNA2_/TRDRNA2_133154_c0~~gnl/TRDRNA2_/TRDRNA2_133154_c0_seq1.p1  ORF type:complete len:334 (-),score=46.89 gnl/TRDRNA2_/TRDRNA2_133154_c0_seq1:187-1188(-)